MSPRRAQPQETPPDLPPQKAHALLSKQMEKLQEIKGQDYRKVEAAEKEWFQFTQKIIERSFGSSSSNYRNFSHADSAGNYYIRPYRGGIDHQLNQNNFIARTTAYENAVKSSLSELAIDLPETLIKGVYEPGQEYELYADVKRILGLAENNLFIIDPYLSTEIFDVYADSIPRTVRFRLLGTNISQPVRLVAQKYATGGNFELRCSTSIHDRAFFADQRGWVCGQSLKDAAKKKPTYIVEVDEPLMRPIYESIWSAAQDAL